MTLNNCNAVIHSSFVLNHRWLLIDLEKLSSYFAGFEEVKKISSHFAEFEQVEKLSRHFDSFEKIEELGHGCFLDSFFVYAHIFGMQF